MDQQAASLLSLLKRTGAHSETKLNQLNALKSDIKHYRVPESAQATIFECLRIAITQSTSSTIATTAFSTLGHLIKRLKIQDATGLTITQLAPKMLGPLQERLGDLREPHRQAASQCLADLYPFLQGDIEHIIRDEAIPGGNPRAKEAAMRWVARMHIDEGMAFKSYVGPIVANLEDSDPTAREAAKSALVELFREASDRAKADLKKQLKAHSVRHIIETQILTQLGDSSSLSGSTSRPHMSASPAPDADLTASTRSLPAFDHTAHFSETINSEAAKLPPAEEVPLDPIYIHSQRELDDTLRDMLPFFQGREEEGNWVQRDKNVLKLRRILKGNAPGEFHAFFMTELKGLMEGILKVANSLRTTVSSNGCQLVQELVRTLGPAADHHVEILLQNFIKMSAVTKPIAANNGKTTVDAIFQHVSYNIRLMQHIWSAAQDKNAQTRQFSMTWLQTMLGRQAGYKSQFEHSGGLDLATKCIDKGLNDANPKVKEASRAVYWTFARDWPRQADGIMAKLDPKSKTMLEKDPNNPNAALHGSMASSASSLRSTAGSRAALREQIAAQRKAKMAHRLPERPNTAMADLSPVKQRTTPAAAAQRTGPSKLRNDTRAPSTATAAPSTSTASTTTTGKPGSSLMSGPVRRPRRPEPPRPQTADPYASRRLLTRPETPANETPAHSPSKGTSASKTSTASTAASRNRAQTASSAKSLNGSPVKTRSPVASRIPQSSPRPVSRGSQAGHSDETSISRVADDFTMVMPKNTTGSRAAERGAMLSKQPPLEQAVSADTGMRGMDDEDDDNFTMVMPSMGRDEPRMLSPPANGGSPLKQMFADARRLASDEMTRPGSSRSQRERSGTPVENGFGAPRRGSPTKSVTPQPVQIYEDPFTAEANPYDEANERQVLGELPINGNAGVQSPTQSNDSSNSPAGSPLRNSAHPRSPNPPSTQDRAEVLRNKRLLVSGIERIRSKTLDAHGFRRVQDLTKSPLDIWDGGKAYNELMEVLLGYLESFDNDPKLLQQPSSKSLGLKAQALGLLRGLMTLHRRYGAAWHGHALVTLTIARQGIDHNSHLLTDLERASDEIVKAASSPEACIETILEQPLLQPAGLAVPVKAESNGVADPARPVRSIAMGLLTMRNLLIAASSKARWREDGNVVGPLDPALRSRLAAMISRYLEDADADIRRADVELASELFECVGEDKTTFWNEFTGVDEGRLGLLAYYTARRGRAAQ
ncbi:hypothetical protein K431DRAFT_283150 [Polychaeton citri CBS 116435]|uniref:TOG domain-containing protein n=1 Tax=Polychaeton citri CBS 116435 TaxID=1314669 RepID=A0A9P4Q9Z4_9PEZI|nr:hypothetical protein K431DRAFT_283150 [Polychaeton citri CBS 116435]